MSNPNRDRGTTQQPAAITPASGFSKSFVALLVLGATILSGVAGTMIGKKVDFASVTGVKQDTQQVACPQLLIESITALQQLPTVQQQLADLGRGGAEQDAVVQEVAATTGFKALGQPANFLNVANYLNGEAQRLYDLANRLNSIEAEFAKSNRTGEWNAIVTAMLESKGLKPGQSARKNVEATPVEAPQNTAATVLPGVMQQLVTNYQKR